MKTSPNPLPQGHGVYALIHHPTKRIYIGSSTNLRSRGHEWNASLQGKRRPPPFEVGDHTEWEMRVLKRTEGLTYAELSALETEAIENAKARGLEVLNKIKPHVRISYTIDGIDGSATFHATRLGLTPSLVINKLNRGYTIEQALLREEYLYDAREQILKMMPVRITHEGNPITYSEAAGLAGVAQKTIQERTKRMRTRHPDRKEFTLDEIRHKPT